MGIITKVVTDNDGVNIDSEDLAMRIMDDEGVKLIQQYNPDAATQLPADHIYKTFRAHRPTKSSKPSSKATGIKQAKEIPALACPSN